MGTLLTPSALCLPPALPTAGWGPQVGSPCGLGKVPPPGAAGGKHPAWTGSVEASSVPPVLEAWGPAQGGGTAQLLQSSLVPPRGSRV